MKVKDTALDGVIRQNPVLRTALAVCPALAVSSTLMNAVGMGAAVIVVMILSNVTLSLIGRFIPDNVRMLCCLLVIAAYATAVAMVMQKYFYNIGASLGVFLPLIAFNCLVLTHAESFASKKDIAGSVPDGLFYGLGFAAALFIIALVREFLGAGALFGAEIMQFRIAFFATPAGAFFTYGILFAAFNFVYNKVNKKLKAKQSGREKEQVKKATGTEVDA